jgi:DNA-binding GntR family transcriptional regulator
LEKSENSAAWVKVYEYLKGAIIKGTYGPGEKLNEQEIAERMKVSRTPTREALRILEYEGFVTNVARRGVAVKKYSPEELDTLHKMLIRLEGLAVQMAVPKLTEEDISHLDKMTHRLKSLVAKKNYSEYLTLNFEFHLFFARKTESRELLDTITQLRTRIFRFYYAQITLRQDTDQWVRDHQDVVDALAGRIEAKPHKIMEKHIDHARQYFLSYYRRFGP